MTSQLAPDTQYELHLIQFEVVNLERFLGFLEVDPSTVCGSYEARLRFPMHPHHLEPKLLQHLDSTGLDPDFERILRESIAHPQPEPELKQELGDGGSAGDYGPAKHEVTTSDAFGAPPIMEHMSDFVESLKRLLAKRRLVRQKSREYAERLVNMAGKRQSILDPLKLWISPLRGLRVCVLIVCALSRGAVK